MPAENNQSIEEIIKSLSKEKQNSFKEICNKLNDFQLMLMRNWTLDEFTKTRINLMFAILISLEDKDPEFKEKRSKFSQCSPGIGNRKTDL